MIHIGRYIFHLHVLVDPYNRRSNMMRRQRNHRWTLPITILKVIIIGVLLYYSVGVDAQTGAETTFEDIIADDPSEYAMYQIKFTYTGIQTKGVPTLLLAGDGRVPDVGEFEPHRSPGVHYSNDDVVVIELSVTGTTIQKFVEGLAERPALQIPGGASDPVLSLMIERGSPPDEIVFEHLADDVEAYAILNVLEGASRDEPMETRETVCRFRCFTIGPH
jgi:hypothetical protein